MFLLSLFLAICLSTRTVCGFADNLVTTSVGCMTDLDTSEVIMNNVVKSAEESDYPKMHLVVVDDDENHIESPYQYSASATTLQIAFVNPYSAKEYADGGDLQFVIDVVEGSAEFIEGGALGCDKNKRVSSRLFHGDTVKLQINDPSSTVKLVGGWAAGHEAVRLTPILELDPKKEEDHKEHPHDKVKGDDKPKSDRNSEQLPEAKGADNNNKDSSNSDKQDHAVKTKRRKNQEEIIKIDSDLSKDNTDMKKDQKNPSDIRDALPEGHGITDGKLAAIQRMKNMMNAGQKKAILEEEEQRKRLEDEMNKNFPDHSSFHERYHSEDFGASLHMGGFYFGCAFFALAMGTLLKLLSSKKDKGRRDL